MNTTKDVVPQKLLKIEDLVLHFKTRAGVVQAVDGVDFELDTNRAVVILGESGCGKSSLAKAILRLLPRNVEKYSGEVYLQGTDVMKFDEEQFRQNVRWAQISLVPQAAMNALNPVIKVGDQVSEPAMVHLGLKKEEALILAKRMFQHVGVPEDFVERYPFELSGGMRQRVLIAMALMMKPALVIADEPTTALDVTIQAQILELLVDLQKKFGTSILMITHDLGVIAETTSRVIVMYAGQVVEEAAVDELFSKPHHPYTEGLMFAMPHIGRELERLNVIPGTVPAPTDWPHGCRFRDRCPYSWDLCEREHPPLYQVGVAHTSRCHLAIEPERRNHPHPPLVVLQGAAVA